MPKTEPFGWTSVPPCLARKENRDHHRGGCAEELQLPGRQNDRKFRRKITRKGTKLVSPADLFVGQWTDQSSLWWLWNQHVSHPMSVFWSQSRNVRKITQPRLVWDFIRRFVESDRPYLAARVRCDSGEFHTNGRAVDNRPRIFFHLVQHLISTCHKDVVPIAAPDCEHANGAHPFDTPS